MEQFPIKNLDDKIMFREFAGVSRRLTQQYEKAPAIIQLKPLAER